MDISAISNAGPIIHLVKIGQLLLLKQLFGNIGIPETVKIEIVEKGKVQGKPDALIIEKEINKWIKVLKDPKIKKEFSERSGIHSGEIAAIMLARELNLPVLIDDSSARNFANLMQVRVLGSIGILIKAVKSNILSISNALNALEKLSEVMWLNASIYQKARNSIISSKSSNEEH